MINSTNYINNQDPCPKKIKLFLKTPNNAPVCLNKKQEDILKNTPQKFSKVYKTFVKWNPNEDLSFENITNFVKTRQISESSKIWYISALYQCWCVQHKVDINNLAGLYIRPRIKRRRIQNNLQDSKNIQ